MTFGKEAKEEGIYLDGRVEFMMCQHVFNMG